MTITNSVQLSLMKGNFPIFYFFQEHDCKLTQEIIELIDREADLLMRGVKDTNLEGLRKRIATLFLQYVKTPTFNAEAARLLKVKHLTKSLEIPLGEKPGSNIFYFIVFF